MPAGLFGSENIVGIMLADQVLKVVFKPWELLNKIAEVVCVCLLHEMIHRAGSGNGQGFIILFCGADVLRECYQLRTNIFNCLRNTIPANVYPGQPQVSFVVEEGRVEGAGLELLFKFGVGKVEVGVHGVKIGGKFF